MLRRALFYNFHLVYRFDQWFKRRFTPLGMLLVGTFILAGVFGVNTRATLSYQLVTVAAVLLGAGLASAPFFRGRFAARRQLPRFATAGSPVTYPVTLRNLGKSPERGLALREEPLARAPDVEAWRRGREPREALRNLFDRVVGYPRWSSLMSRSRGARAAEVALPEIGPGRSASVDVTLLPVRRGHLRLGPLTVVRPDPLGVFRAIRRTGEAQSLLVLPRRYRVDWSELLGGARDRPGGESPAASIGGVEAFAGVREYRPGDPMRHIHWKGWARLGAPIVKEFHEETFVRQALVLDTFAPAGSSTARFEEAVSVAASFAGAPAAREGVLELLFVADQAHRLESGRGLAACDRLLEALACVEPAPEGRFEILADSVQRRAGELSACVCVLLDWDAPRRDLVARLRRAGLPVLVLIVVEAGEARDPQPGPMADHPNRLRVIAAGEAEAELATLGVRRVARGAA